MRYFKKTDKFKSVLSRKMHLGVDAMMNLGNLYTASLPAWIAAGLDEAFRAGTELVGRKFLCIGYGSGDAAEAMIIKVVPEWKDAAARIGFEEALEGAVDLKQEEYEALHDGLSGPCPKVTPSFQFVVDSIGNHSQWLSRPRHRILPIYPRVRRFRNPRRRDAGRVKAPPHFSGDNQIIPICP